MQERCVILHCAANIQNRLKDIVVDLDQVEGFLRCVRIDGSHGSHGVTVIQRFAIGQNVRTQMTQVCRALTEFANLVFGHLEIIDRYYRLDARIRLRLARID